MRMRVLPFVLSGLLPCPGSAVPAPPSPEPPLALVHVAVVDVAAGSVLPDRTVLVSGGRIAEVFPSRASAVPSDARVVDLAGKYVVPGLWDMHVHLSDAGERALGMLVESGVLGVRDLGSEIGQIDSWRDAIAKRSRVGPEIVRAGPVVDGPNPGAPHRLTLRTAGEARCTVTTLKNGLGVDWIKVHASLAREPFFALLAEARADRIPVACHLPTSATAAEASEHGCRTLEHAAESLIATWGYERVHPSKSPEESADRLVGEPGRRLFEVLRRNRTWVDPTLVGYESFVKMGRDPEETQARQAILDKQILAVGIMHRMGVRLLAGTDLSDDEMGLTPGDSLHRELEYLVKSGLTPPEALRVATRDAAEVLGRLAETGTVEKGKRADLVILDADPLAEVANLRRISAVVLRGKLLPKGESKP